MEATIVAHDGQPVSLETGLYDPTSQIPTHAGRERAVADDAGARHARLIRFRIHPESAGPPPAMRSASSSSRGR